MMKTELSIVIDAPVEVVCGYLVNPAHMQEYIGADEVEVKGIQRLPNGGYRYVATEPLLLGLHTSTALEGVEVVPNERTVTKAHSALVDGSVSWRFERLAGGKTRVNIVEEYKVHGGPLGKLGEAFFARSFKEGVARHLQTAKARIEEAERQTATPN